MILPRKIVLVLFLVGWFYAVPAFGLDDSKLAQLKRYIGGVAQKIGSKNTLAVELRDVVTGKVIYSRNSDKSLVPASVAKIVTSVSALEVLGGSYQFPTEIFVDRKPGKNKGNVGNLYVRGYGDPTMVDERMWFLVKELQNLGVKSVDKIVLDDTLFLDPPGPGGHRAYDSGLGGLTINHNAYSTTIAPTSSGQKGLVSPTLGAPIKVVNNTKTVPGKRQRLSLTQSPASTSYKLQTLGLSNEGYERISRDPITITVSGTIGENASAKTYYRSAPSPTLFYGEIFLSKLKAFGIEVEGDLYRGATSNKAHLLKTFQSKQLALVLRELNQYSNNITAGQILYLLGQDENGYFSREKGLDRLNSLLKSVGAEGALGAAEGQLFDGSGLDRRNRLTVSLLTKLLVKAYSDYSSGPELVSSLSRYKRSGTLKDRLFGKGDVRSYIKSGNIWGKTGTLTGVSSLAGILQMSSGRRAAYAIIVNGGLSKDSSVKIERNIMEILVGAK